jgi:hypothetical protein
MLGNRLITKQTGVEGRPCNTVLVVEPLAAKMEKYFAILYDRAVGGPLVIASAKGGVTIEDIAEKDPSCIIKEPIDIAKGMSASQALSIATKMQFGSASATKQVIYLPPALLLFSSLICFSPPLSTFLLPHLLFSSLICFSPPSSAFLLPHLLFPSFICFSPPSSIALAGL